MPSSCYTYLISSLPMLHFGSRPSLSFERFIQLCQGLIPEDKIQLLQAARQSISGIYEGSYPILKKWYSFDRALRNELVKIRSERKHLDPNRYLREDGYSGPSLAHTALSAHRNPAILESERFLDKERWNFLEELSLGHYFDMDFLIAYALKLLILERWEIVDSQDKSQILEDLLSRAQVKA